MIFSSYGESCSADKTGGVEVYEIGDGAYEIGQAGDCEVLCLQEVLQRRLCWTGHYNM
jgi:hypothetical protein